MKVLIISFNTLPASPSEPVYVAGAVRQAGHEVQIYERLFATPVFEGGRLERWIRWLFLANGASAVVTIFGVVVDSPAIYLLGSLVPSRKP